MTETIPVESVATPKNQERFRDVEGVEGDVALPISFNEQLSGASPSVAPVEDAPISMQDFLNVTNIRFMDLTNTKRRHTVVPSSGQGRDGVQDVSDNGLADCVVAGACIDPTLNLFEHVSLCTFISHSH